MSRMRTKTAREVYVEQFPHNRKKKSFTHLHSYDDSDVAYRSAPEYLRQLLNTSNDQSVRSMTRTRSASEMSSANNLNRSTGGNPKYKAQEDYYDEIQLLKKEFKYIKDDNSNLRAKIRRLEEDNARKRKEIESLFDTNKEGDARRTSAGSTIPVNNVVMNLKQRIFKLESQVRHKEIAIDELKNDPRWTKSVELEIQNRALYNEIEKQKIERANIIHHDYMASIDEEKKNAVKKLEVEKHELKIENDNLKKKTHELEQLARNEQLSARHRDGNTDRDLHRRFEDLKELCRNYENDLDKMKDDLKQVRRERDKFREKFEVTSEALEALKRDRDPNRSHFGRNDHDMDDRRHERDRATKDHHPSDRSSPAFKRDGIHQTHQSHSPRPSTKALHEDFDSWDEYNKKDSRSNVAVRKSNEQIGPRSSSSKLDRDGHSPSVPYRSAGSSRHLHRDDRISDDDDDDDSRGDKFRDKSKQDTSDTKHSRTGGGLKLSETHLAHGSQQKLGSKTDNLGSGVFKSRPASSHISHEAAVQIVQASLRGCLNRMESDKTSRTPKSHRLDSDEEDSIKTPSRQYGSERPRESFLNNSRQHLGNDSYLRKETTGSNNRNATSNFRQTPPPPRDSSSYSSPYTAGSSGLKSTGPPDRNKLGFGTRIDRDLPSEPRGSPLPTADIHRSASPRFGSGGLKQSAVDDKIKFASDRDSTSRLQRSSSPSADQQRFAHPQSSDNARSFPRQSNNSLRKGPTDLKQSLKNSHNDDDDVEMF